MSAPVRIAVAGAGAIGQAHIKRILAEPQAELGAIIDPSPKARDQAASLGVPWFADLEIGLQSAKPDGVVIATPNHLHVPNGLTAVKAGVPMLLEKPVSDDVESAMKLVTAAEAAGVSILVGHHRRHSPLIQRAREIVESGRLGQITAVTGLCLLKKPNHGYFDGPGAWRSQPGGGVVLINLIHVVDDLRNICGDVVSVQAAESNVARGFPGGHGGRDPALRQWRARHSHHLGRRRRALELGADLRGEQGIPSHRSALLSGGGLKRFAHRAALGRLEP